MNNIVEIVENLKTIYRSIHNLKKDEKVKQTDISLMIGAAENTITNYITKAMIPHSLILTFCYENKISYKDIYYKKVDRVCNKCENKITSENGIIYTTKKKDENGNFIEKYRRECRICYNNKRKNEKNKSVPRVNNCTYCEKSFDEVKRITFTYTTKANKTITRLNQYCEECGGTEELLRESRLKKKRLDNKTKYRISKPKHQKKQKPKKKPKPKPTKKEIKKQKVEAIKKVLETKIVVEKQIIKPIEQKKPKISKAKQAILDLMDEKKKRKEHARELTIEEKLIKQYLGE